MRLRRALLLAGVIWLGLGATMPARASRTARVTFYAFQGVQANGDWTWLGSAACSYDLALGTRVTFLDSGETVTCTDRGYLGSGSPTWIDVFDPNGWANVAPWGDWREIEVWQ